MKPFKDYETTQVYTDREKIPVGAYIAVIKNAEVKKYDGANGSFEKLEIAIDIAEGEYKNYYADDYRSQTGEDKKWKGVIRQYVPTDDGSERDGWTKQAVKTLITAIEESNPGYHWDWDEKKFKGKKVGLLMRNEEWEYNGKTGWTTRPFKFISAEAVKNSKYKFPADKPLNGNAGKVNNNSTDSGFTVVDDALEDDDLPF